ncbi:PREDICTED: kinesin-like protein KIN-7H isoform X4 [Lupinus angustifolius]|uniref:kinesin-like protein KIN-7H isoform X4 n=1 Tax=Lupinus angustifolius TaxID=3871 RepID=UPI00092EAA25|nr:PREDICTED: kinesin-like protein KIN-7H isoform X4 [Lupinus angustifolius]
MGSVEGEEAMQQGHVERIFVSVRLRPLNDRELAKNDVSEWECINDTTIICRNNLTASDRSLYPIAYSFDRVFRGDCSTRQVYEEAAKEVAFSVVSGINSSIFAYGQTSSGKTYAMSGITEYAVADIYNYIEKHREREFVMKFSAIEIYNESVRDLLSEDSTPLRLLDDPERGTVIEKLIEETLRDWNHFTELIALCETQRQIGDTPLNNASSRSHQILRLTIQSSALEFQGSDKSSSLLASVNFVDLAGSERVSQTNSAGTRLKEGSHINRSLLTLGTVIRKLSRGRNGHIPFRDSKLTRILQSSLGGNARTAIICTMSPARSHVEQSRNTLLFASCAKEVVTNAQVNVVVSDKALVKQLEKEVSRLENELRNSSISRPISDSTALLREKDLQIEMEWGHWNFATFEHAFLVAAKMNSVVPPLKCMQLKKEVQEVTRKLDWAQSQMKGTTQVVEDDLPHIRESMDLHYPKLSMDLHYPKLSARKTWDFENQSENLNVLSDGEDSIGSFHASQHSDGDSFSSDENLFQLPDLEKNLSTRSASMGLSIANMDALSNESKGLITKSHTHSNQTDLSPKDRWTDSNTPPPAATTAYSGLTVVDNGVKKDLNLSYSELKEDKVYTLNYNTNPERKSLDRYTNFVDHSQNVESSTRKETERNGPKGKAQENKSLNLMADHEITEKGTNPIIATKKFKDVGLDPMQVEGENHSNWPSEFKRLQREIVELWDANNISLIHRTYFFLLFKGDPSDYIYMEVELRRLSYIKQTFSQGNKIAESGRTLTPGSSIKKLKRERRMLRKQIRRRLSKSERENMYLKWGLRSSSKHKRSQLVQRLWSDTKDMHQVGESAAIVAKLVGPVEPNQALKEMFGLNFAPRPTSKKSTGCTASMKHIC